MPSLSLPQASLQRNTSNTSLSSAGSSFLKKSGHRKAPSAQKHSVSFAPMVAVLRVQSIEEDDKPNVWYNREDIQTIKKRNVFTAHLFQQGNLVESDDQTFIGLERYLRKNELKTFRDALYDAVLNEQARQQSKRHPRYNPDKIARAYRRQMQCISNE